jgi:hypothetical protein
MSIRGFGVLALAIWIVSGTAWAQSPAPVSGVELSASLGRSKNFGADADAPGTSAHDFGAGVEWRVSRRLGAGLDYVHRGDHGVQLLTCDSPGYSTLTHCAGSARDGVFFNRSVTALLAWYFGNPRAEVYLLTGIGVMSSHMVTAKLTSDAPPMARTFREREERPTGIGPAFGLGFRIPIGTHVVVRPEVRFTIGEAGSGSILNNAARASIAVGWKW